MTTVDPIDLAMRLIACRSVTPADGGAMAMLGQALEPLGFTVHRLTSGEAPDGPVENMFAVRDSGPGPHFAFAGHTDVVPPGNGWTDDAFAPAIRGDLLYGRGAVDMKGAIAAFVAAVAAAPVRPGKLSLIITGDEEGPATFGTPAIMDWMAQNGERPDAILVGEPTSSKRVGDMAKIGRRGSVNIWIEVPGVQGHVAYPHLADNPVTRLVRILDRLKADPIDAGNAWFDASNLEVTDIEVGNAAANVIPARAAARLNIRFNDLQSGEGLIEWVRGIVVDEAPAAAVTASISGESFITPPGPLSDLVAQAIRDEAGIEPQLSTTGGTSDARFLRKLCPVIEFGLPNATMHKVDEAAAVEDIRLLSRIYARVLDRYFAA